jgi:hypothetical protein
MTRQITTRRAGPYALSVEVCENIAGFESGYIMTIPGHGLKDGTTIEWRVRYGAETQEDRHVVASILSSMQYMLSPCITTTEAIDRLRLLRREYARAKDVAR